MINVRAQKNLVIPIVEDLLGKHGFCSTKQEELLFVKEEAERVIKISFYFTNTGLSGNTLYSITFKKVEDIIFKVGLANNNLLDSTNKYDILSTIYDNESAYTYTDRPLKIGYSEENLRKKVESFKDVESWIQAFGTYVLHDGNDFLSRYSNLFSLNRKLTELRITGQKKYSTLLLGGIDHLFRALIISKLCRDPHHVEKEKYFDSLILQNRYSMWHKNYEDLKLLLLDVKPIEDFTT